MHGGHSVGSGADHTVHPAGRGDGIEYTDKLLLTKQYYWYACKALIINCENNIALYLRQPHTETQLWGLYS